ncbi:MAG: PfkB family carbohydrate kinase [Thermoproteus sp.]
MRAVVVANPTIDYVITNEKTERRIGGPPYYMGLAFSALGITAGAIGVVGPEEKEFIEGELRKVGVEPRLIVGDATTVFELDYRQRPRRSRALRRPSVKISGTVEGPLVVLNPVYDEIGDVKFYADVSAVDLQGFIRSGGEAPEADIVHFSDDDIYIDPRRLAGYNSRWRIAVYTLGAGGAYMAVEGRLYYAPSAQIEVEDATGSGDVFLAVFAAYMLKTADPERALCEASMYVAGYLATRRVERMPYGCEVSVVRL